MQRCKDSFFFFFNAFRIFQHSFAYGLEDHMFPDKIYSTGWQHERKRQREEKKKVQHYTSNNRFLLLIYIIYAVVRFRVMGANHSLVSFKLPGDMF